MTVSVALASIAATAPTTLPTEAARAAAQDNPVMAAVLTAADNAAREVAAQGGTMLDQEQLARAILDEMARRPEFQVAQQQTDTVSFLSSPTTWGPLIGLASMVMAGFGWRLVPEDQSALVAHISGTFGVLGLAFALWKRNRSQAQPVRWLPR